MNQQMDDTVVIVTGASRGIGRSICLKFCEKGASVVGVARSEGDLQQTLEEVQTHGDQTLAVPADVQSMEDTQHVIERTKEEYGSIDVLVNNAGISRDQLLMRLSEEDWNEVLETNLGGTFRFSRAVARQMMRQKSGRIVNISSVVGLTGNPGQTNYCASKAGMIGFTKSLAKELGSRGIRVNAVAPGYIQTELTEDMTDEQRENIKNSTALERLGTPDEVADTVLFLAGSSSRYITGQVLVVDGGMHM